MGHCDQFRLLLWKNFILQKRRPIATIFELLLPILFSVLLVIIRGTVDVTNHPDTTTWPEFTVNNLPPFSPEVLPKDHEWVIAYAPNNFTVIDRVMENVKAKLNNIPKSELEIKCGFDMEMLKGDSYLNSMNLAGMGGPEDMPSMAGNPMSGGMQQMLRGTAELIFNKFPRSMQEIVEEKASEQNVTATDLLVGVLQGKNMEVFMRDLMTEYMNKTIECILSELPAEQRELMESFQEYKTQSTNTTSSAGNVSMEELITSTFGIVPTVRLTSFESEALFLEYVKNDTNLKHVLAGVIFNGILSDKTLPNDAQITLRFHSDPVSSSTKDSSAFTGITDTWKTNKLFPDFQIPGPRESSSDTGGKPGYYREGFLSLMHAVDMAIGSVLSNSSTDKASFGLKRYPYPPYLEDNFILAIQNTLPLLIMLSFFYTSLVIVRSVVQEKESKMKEYMMMMGLSSWLHWLAWFLKYILFLCISCIFMVGFYKIKTDKGSVLTNSDVSVVFVFLILFSAATINLCFLISVFFSKANVGAAAGGVLYAMTYMPYLFMQTNFNNLSQSLKLAACLLSNVAMASGCNLIGMFEGKGTGIQWSNLNKGVTIDNQFTLLQVLLMLMVDAILYMLLAVYIEGVWPGEYGVPKPWYFPFLKSYWFGHAKSELKYSDWDSTEGNENITYARDDAGEDGEYFEEEPTDLRRVVEIKKLKKVFKVGGNEKVAVDDLNLNMYDGQITVLLGHNGAGKTTTMSMLTGFFPPTSGEASVNGHSIINDIGGVRRSLGLCPQFNILFDLLTVDEHLYFFGRLKGLSIAAANAESEEMKAVLKLNDKASAKSKTLSGGMKRKLSVGIALSAGSKYVILDEPTSGMDPAARRAIWDVLQCYRNRCSILLSTHFMDEADLLGDRIAIMAQGKLRCVGSSVFLKNKFGVGYHVVLTKTPECDINKLTDLMESFVPEASLERSAGAELSFVLPFQASPQFPQLFNSLDDKSTSLGISGFGAVVTTMEEVFLRVTEDAESAVKSVSRRLSFSKSEMLRKASFESSEDSDDLLKPLNGQKNYLHTSLRLNSGVILWLQQFYGLLVKKIIHTRRNYKVAIAQIIVPVFFAVLAILNAKFPPFEQKNEPFDLNLDAYGPNNVYVDNPSLLAFGQLYKDQFHGTVEHAMQHNGDLDEYLSDMFNREGGDFNTDNIVSASFINESADSSHAIAWFNNQAYHTPASSLAYLDQAYIRLVTQRNISFRFTNYPLPRNSTNRVQEQLLGSLSGFLMAFNIVLGFSFLAASFCLFLVRERVDRSALLQTLAGVDPFCFWFTAFVWDFINFITPCLLTVAMFAAFSVNEFIEHAGIVVLLFALYCWASLPLMYLLSLLFSVPSTALVRVTILNIITGLASIITINVLRLLSLGNIADSLNWVFLLMPQYCLGQGLADVYTNVKMVNICTTSEELELYCRLLGIDFQTDFMAWQQYGVGKFTTFLGIQGILFFCVLYMVEFDLFGVVWRLIPRKKNTVQHIEANNYDDDVTQECNRINDSELPHLVSSDRLIIKNLRKVYGKALVAVNGIHIGIPEAECFGLLGINGAGKTTTFKMITGDLRPSGGTAYLDGYDITKQLRKAQQRMGYCPQFDALIEQMTGTETLWMFARLRGVPESDIAACVQNLGKILHFTEHLDKPCGTYSGGNRRKLSTAVALVGNPPVVLLDEPSTGMDPGARRMLWDALTAVRASGRSIVISSHSMEECEALCTRLAIMVNGTLRCIGGPQHLKSKFGQGYTVEVKATNSEAKAQMHRIFPGCVVKDEHQGLLTYHIPQYKQDSSELKLAMIFDLMEKSKQQFGFGDYTVTQTTLEQVFLSLVRWQREATDDSNATVA